MTEPMHIKTVPDERDVPPAPAVSKRQAHEITTTVIRRTQVSARRALTFEDLEPADPDDQHGGPTFGYSRGGGGAA